MISISSNVSAASGECWYDANKTCSVPGYGACGTNDVLPGRTTGCAGKAIRDGIDNKKKFIDFIEEKINAGGRDAKGARFLMSAMLSNKSDPTAVKEENKNFNNWKSIMERNEVRVYRDANTSLKNTSWYDPNKDDFFFDTYSTVRDTIKIEFDGTVVMKIEALCGNLAEKDGNIKPTARLDARDEDNATINVGGKFKFRQMIEASNRDSVGDDQFSWSISGEGGAKGGTKSIAGDSLRVDDTYEKTYNTRGSYTRTIKIDSAPSINADYVKIGNDSATQTLTVNGWDIYPDSSVNKPTIIVGQSATFTHRLYSSGAPLHKDVDGDVVIAAGSSSLPQCGASGADSTECWNYRFKDTDLTPTDSDQTASRTYTFTQTGTYCEQISYNPDADNDTTPTLYDYSGYSLGTKACVDVIDPTPTASTGAEYEKGGPGVNTNVGVKFDGPCPTVGITVKWYYSVPELGLNNIEQDANYGGGFGCESTNKPIPLGDYAAILNGKSPGTTYATESYVPDTNERVSGEFSVIEVPFARFYGNDIYASGTNGEIRFNDTGDPNNAVQRGSVNQYAALAFGNVQIDTSSFRTLPIAAPNPPNGLDVANVGADLNRIKATSVYNDVKNNLPTNCGTTPSSYLLPGLSGCYTVSDDYRIPGIPRIGGSDGYTCTDIKKINPAHDCSLWWNAFAYNTSNYNQKITLVNSDPNKPFLIVGDLINTNNEGVLLIVSAGDIIIDNNVKRVDAILVSNKSIYTCGWTWGSNYGSKINQGDIDAVCRSNLTINGALSAPTIDFRRSGGSRYLNASGGDEQQNCNISKGIQNCGDRGDMPLDTGKTAEIVNFPAYLYFAKPFLRDTTASGADTDAIFVAPPRL